MCEDNGWEAGSPGHSFRPASLMSLQVHKLNHNYMLVHVCTLPHFFTPFLFYLWFCKYPEQMLRCSEQNSSTPAKTWQTFKIRPACNSILLISLLHRCCTAPSVSPVQIGNQPVCQKCSPKFKSSWILAKTTGHNIPHRALNPGHHGKPGMLPNELCANLTYPLSTLSR